jgi:hypothetical protein
MPTKLCLGDISCIQFLASPASRAIIASLKWRWLTSLKISSHNSMCRLIWHGDATSERLLCPTEDPGRCLPIPSMHIHGNADSSKDTHSCAYEVPARVPSRGGYEVIRSESKSLILVQRLYVLDISKCLAACTLLNGTLVALLYK